MKSILVITVAIAFLSLFMRADIANAQAKVSVEQAWSQCLKEVDTTVGPKDEENDAERTAAFKACMGRLGHGAGK